MVKALAVVMLLAASAAIAAAHPGLLHKGIIGINVNHGGNSSEGDSGNSTEMAMAPRVASWAAARRSDGDNTTDSAAPTKTIKLAHGLITINIAHQQAVVADTNGTATKTISLAGLFNHGGASASREMSGNETGTQTISLHQILSHIATHGGTAAASDGNTTATVKTITLPSIFSHIHTASVGSSNGGDGNATAVTFPHPLSSLLSKHMSVGASNGGDSNETGTMQPMMFRRAEGEDNSTAMPATKTISINIGHGGVASSGDSNSTGHIFSHGRRLNTLGHIIKAAHGSMGGDSNSTMDSSSGAMGGKTISINFNKGGHSDNSSDDSGNTTARTGAGGVSLRIGGGCSCTKDCQPATQKVCRDVTRDQETCSDVTSYDVGMSCTKKCFDPSKIMAIAHGRRRLLSANSVNTIPHIAHGIAKSVIVGGGNGNGTDSGNRTATVGSSEICKEICKPSVTPVTKKVCKIMKVVETVCEDKVTVTCTPRCSCNGGNGGHGILGSILAHHGH